MRRSRNFHWAQILIVMLAGLVGAPSAFSQYAPGGPRLKGTVKSLEGKPLEGVTVSACRTSPYFSIQTAALLGL